MIKRTSIKFINELLNKNKNWNVLDIGCGYEPNKYSNVLADKIDFSKRYPDKKFVKIQDKILPFKDKEFDFVIASHVIEHVEDMEFFLKELERISYKGYIELPTRLEDNLVFENRNDHIWFFIFDDINQKLVCSKRKQLLDPLITVALAKKFDNIFRESLVLELFWESKINYEINDNIRLEQIKKTSAFTLFRKYVSKKIRLLFR